MSITASLAVSPSACFIETPVNCSLTVTNSTTGAITVTSVQPIVTCNGGTGVPSAAIGTVNLGPNTPYAAINASGSTGSVVIPFSVVFHVPSTSASGGLFAVGANVVTSDGSNPSVTVATVSVSGITQLASEL